MRIALPALATVAALTAGPGYAASAFTKLDTDACRKVASYEDGGADLDCPGYKGIGVFVNIGDARADVDYGFRNDSFETFSAFNGPGDTVEWMLDDAGKPYAAALRFFIDVDGRHAQALVVSRIGTADKPGCVVGVVDAAADQANGIARGLGAMARLFDCSSDSVIVVPGASELAGAFNGANQ